MNPKIRQWQFIQKDSCSYLLRLSISDESLKSEEPEIIQLLKDMLGMDARISIEYLYEIPVLNSGKRKMVIQEYKPLQ
jgi:phenylacetate-CoA ligase